MAVAGVITGSYFQNSILAAISHEIIGTQRQKKTKKKEGGHRNVNGEEEETTSIGEEK